MTIVALTVYLVLTTLVQPWKVPLANCYDTLLAAMLLILIVYCKSLPQPAEKEMASIDGAFVALTMPSFVFCAGGVVFALAVVFRYGRTGRVPSVLNLYFSIKDAEALAIAWQQMASAVSAERMQQSLSNWQAYDLAALRNTLKVMSSYDDLCVQDHSKNQTQSTDAHSFMSLRLSVGESLPDEKARAPTSIEPPELGQPADVMSLRLSSPESVPDKKACAPTSIEPPELGQPADVEARSNSTLSSMV